jgi:hypothetical protein
MHPINASTPEDGTSETEILGVHLVPDGHAHHLNGPDLLAKAQNPELMGRLQKEVLSFADFCSC